MSKLNKLNQQLSGVNQPPPVRKRVTPPPALRLAQLNDEDFGLMARKSFLAITDLLQSTREAYLTQPFSDHHNDHFNLRLLRRGMDCFVDVAQEWLLHRTFDAALADAVLKKHALDARKFFEDCLAAAVTHHYKNELDQYERHEQQLRQQVDTLKSEVRALQVRASEAQRAAAAPETDQLKKEILGLQKSLLEAQQKVEKAHSGASRERERHAAEMRELRAERDQLKAQVARQDFSYFELVTSDLSEALSLCLFHDLQAPKRNADGQYKVKVLHRDYQQWRSNVPDPKAHVASVIQPKVKKG